MIETRSKKWYGCIRDTLDARDEMYRPRAVRLPKEVDLRALCPPVMDQGAIGSCVAHGVSTAFRYIERKTGQQDFDISRLWIYYKARQIEDTINDDAGAEIRDGIKVVAKMGAPNERYWPYDTKRFMDAPPAECDTEALANRAIEYRRVTVSSRALKNALADGYPVVIGISLYDSFESDEVAATGIVPHPDVDKEGLVGGHCMVTVGYKLLNGELHFIVRNSWNTDWGDKGDCYIPARYLGSPSFSSDFWIIKKTT